MKIKFYLLSFFLVISQIIFNVDGYTGYAPASQHSGNKSILPELEAALNNPPKKVILYTPQNNPFNQLIQTIRVVSNLQWNMGFYRQVNIQGQDKIFKCL